MKAGVLVLCLFTVACTAPRRPRSAAAPKPPVLDEEARKRVAREFSEAVDAYMKADYGKARALIGSILAADPGNADALSLRRRVKAVEKLSTE